jgi:hypothetical protein
MLYVHIGSGFDKLGLNQFFTDLSKQIVLENKPLGVAI